MSEQEAEAAEFAEVFRQLVAPRLVTMAQVQGALVALNLVQFEPAYGSVIRLAIKHGATHLPDSIFHHLQDFIAIEVLKAATLCEPTIVRAAQRAKCIARQAVKL